MQMMKITPTWTRTPPTKPGKYFVLYDFMRLENMVHVVKDHVTGELWCGASTLDFRKWNCWWSELVEFDLSNAPMTKTEKGEM
jgi:hypothetical protein